MTLRAPFPYFGGKSRVAGPVWDAMGALANYVEPFAGSLAMLLANPRPAATETVNDLDCWIANFWRATRAAPDDVAQHADYPVSEIDLHARGDRLFYGPDTPAFCERLRADPDYFDARVAGWWVWGQCAWIGGGWGPRADGGQVYRQLLHIGGGGSGVHRKRPHLSSAGKGVHAGRPADQRAWLTDWMTALAARLRNVRVCCGDWRRVLGPSVTVVHGLTGVFLDPPYSHAERDPDLYATETDCAAEVRDWCAENGDDPRLRVVLCGYAGEHDALEDLGWRVQAWKAPGGYGSQSQGRGRDNTARERLWFSPHCLSPAESLPLFARRAAPEAA